MIEVYGASDDLIEVEGSIRDEFTYQDDADGLGGDLLAFSSGVVLRIEYGNSGVWRITAVHVPSGQAITVNQAPENDDDNYSDRALVPDAEWVVHGTSYAAPRQGQTPDRTESGGST